RPFWSLFCCQNAPESQSFCPWVSTDHTEQFCTPASSRNLRTMKTRCARELSIVLSIAALASGNAVFGQSTVDQHTYPGLTLTGTAPQPVALRYVDVLANSNNNWTVLTNFPLPQSPYLVIDPSLPDIAHRFYEVSNASIAS